MVVDGRRGSGDRCFAVRGVLSSRVGAPVGCDLISVWPGYRVTVADTSSATQWEA
jgi:hypothetical protein